MRLLRYILPLSIKNLQCRNASTTNFSDALSCIEKKAPIFRIHQKNVRILISPKEFHDTLKEQILLAKRDVFLQTLYIGSSEYDLISIISLALQRNPKLKVSILTDALRGTREFPSECTATLLAPLLDYPNVEVSMYQTPAFTTFLKKILARRWREGVGSQHMKIYGFDDTVICSGANLSNDYFTNRQDRYWVFHDKDLTSYHRKLHAAVKQISYQLSRTAELSSPPLKSVTFREFFQPGSYGEGNITVYPLLQLPYHNITSESDALQILLTVPGDWVLTSGYFHPPPWLQSLLHAREDHGTVITAAPNAYIFFIFGASNLLPDVYENYLSDFKKASQNARFVEWERPGWTYHAKGIWINPPNSSQTITLLGSSNFGHRSYNCDIENTMIIVCPRDLAMTETDRLFHHTAPKKDRKTRFISRVGGWLFSRFV
ncbi:CDP-diacylglycerol--glycerol-3-phosphate 3-phosphatidyltransferase [Neolecta irregularis DAH-3]|uniref:CDP-diacylglycerol--glycerol-3-phosphate 3-phosphatidyltransferase n=1 Tax=Neolecta irregularis (strain DAH-3) TaxID=1198029 RepID=A0A1U7LLW1_NEOID|nr:CDP-diacylglycerol--glycerol-3-phosphate 3-phosphatidyltransferase [Neolecta irregularis DAH-3]|eukprot:OLL23532.1 CDP-diacylglycerol--glycerol-3-phosphate 3-phosphatidyltransferase [Neolecta irregularis DAH-3]